MAVTTCCPVCSAPVLWRQFLSDARDTPLWAETYGCGAVVLWGALEVAVGDAGTGQRVRSCRGVKDEGVIDEAT